MKAVCYTECLPASDPRSLVDTELPMPPAPAGHDLLVEVRAISINPVDTKQRGGVPPKSGPRVLGFDCAGVVRGAGPDTRLFSPGDEVFYAGVINRPGTNAEYHLVDERIVGPKPQRLSFAEAAAMPLTAITAWEALFDRLRLPRGGAGHEAAVLISGGAGGVGSIAIQLLRRLTSFMVVATAGRPETTAWCRDMGAHAVLDHRGDLPAQARALGVPVPHVFSVTRTPQHWNALTELLAPQGGICVIDDLGDADVTRLRPKAGFLAFESMFTRPLHRTPDMIAQHHLLAEVSHLLDTGALRSTMTRNLGRISAATLREAHGLIESGTTIGKIVLEGFRA